MRGVVWLLLLIALGSVAAAQAQDEAPTPSGTGAAERTEPEEAVDQGAATGQEERAPAAEATPAQPPPEAKPSLEVFVPTEDISEDLSVRFPVDI